MKNTYKSLLTGFCVLLFAAKTIASCGCGACAVDKVVLPEQAAASASNSSFILGLSYEYVDQFTPYLNDSPSRVGALPDRHHDEVHTINRKTALTGLYQLNENWGFSFELPYISRFHHHIHNHDDGAEIIPEYWEYSGIGDLSLYTHYSFKTGKSWKSPTFTFTGGITLPTGVTNMISDKGEAEASIQPGTGAFASTFGLRMSQPVMKYVTDGQEMILPVWINTTAIFYGNGTNGWKFGRSLMVNLGTRYHQSQVLAWTLSIDSQFQAMAAPGQTGEPVDVTGGTYIYGTPGFEYCLMPGWQLKGVVQIPIYRRPNSLQIVADLPVKVGMTVAL